MLDILKKGSNKRAVTGSPIQPSPNEEIVIPS